MNDLQGIDLKKPLKCVYMFVSLIKMWTLFTTK